LRTLYYIAWIVGAIAVIFLIYGIISSLLKWIWVSKLYAFRHAIGLANFCRWQVLSVKFALRI